MTAIEAARLVTSTHTCHLLRPRKESPNEYDAKPFLTGNKRGWFYLDLFSASAIVSVHDHLNESNKLKFSSIPLPQMAQFAFKILGGKS
jgi:hypothetical protein